MIYPLQTKKLSFSYPGSGRQILKNIDFMITEGKIKAVVGLSGSGKSTFCYCLSGVIPHIYSGELSGHVFVQGKAVDKLKISEISTKVGIVFQNPDTQLFFTIVEDELAFGPENLCVPRFEIGKRIKKTLALLGIADLRYAEIANLSGGQKQLVALASVLTLEPEILIFDEVMSQIDKIGKKRIKNVIIDLKNKGKTIIMVEHELDNIDLADEVLLLKKGRLTQFEGKLL